MAKKKQRRRRDKDRRHEYEYVLVDEEGREVGVEEPEEPEKKSSKRASKDPAKPIRSGGRVIQPPSWSKVFRRTAIFAPVMLIVLYVLQGKDKSIAAAVVQTMIMLALFIPFSYFMDTMLYRSYRKRLDRAGGQGKRKQRGS